MDKYTKAFIVASLLYLLAGSLLGLIMGLNSSLAILYFTHVHLNLLGFMAMMIYGVGYFIIPRFNARALRWPRLIAVHFYSANIGLLGMCLFRQLSLGVDSKLLIHLFAAFSVIEIGSITLFVVNLIGTLASKATMVGAASRQVVGLPGGGALGIAKGQSGDASIARGPGRKIVSSDVGVEKAASGPGTAASSFSGDGRITPEMRVGEILERLPGARLIMAEAGIRALANEAHAEQVKKMPVTLGAACLKHGVDIDSLIGRLEGHVKGDKITSDMLIGKTIEQHPSTEKVFLEYFGAGCFDCPGQVMESIEQGAMMHNVNAEELVSALNQAASES